MSKSLADIDFRELPLAVMRGQIDGGKVVDRSGYNPEVGNGDGFYTVWDGAAVYTYLASAATLKISSSSTDDTSAGSGLRTVYIYGLDGDYNEINETVILNGRTAVTTTNSFLRVFGLIGMSAGAGGTNDGDIYAGTGTVSSGVPDSVYAKMITAYGETKMAMYTVPAGFTAYIYNPAAGVAEDKIVHPRFVVRPEGGIFQTKKISPLYRQYTQLVPHFPFKVTEKMDVEIQAKGPSGTTDCAASFEVLLLENR